MLTKKNVLRILINTLVGIVLVVLWLKLINLNEVIAGLRKVNLLEVAPFVLFFVLGNLFRSLRLKILLSNFKIPLFDLIKLNYLSQLLSFTIPLRVGEMSKGVYLSTNYNIELPKALIWSFLDRFLDFLMVLTLALILLIILPTNLPADLKPILFLIVLGVGTISSLIFFKPNIAKTLIKIFSKILISKKLSTFFVQITSYLVDSTAFLNKGFNKTSLIIFLTFLANLSDALSYFVVFSAVFKTFSLNILTIILGSLMSALTYLIPAAPGYVGSAEAAGLFVFSFGLGLDKTLTSIALVVLHLLTLSCILILGLLSLYLLKFDLNLVWKKFKR